MPSTSQPITVSREISSEEIIYQIKLSCQLPLVLEAIATCRIITHAAIAAGIQVGVAELQRAADAFRVDRHLERSEDMWLWLRKHGISLDEFEEMLRLNVLTAKLANHLFARQAESLFVERKLDYVQVIMYEIILEDEDLAVELFNAIQEGKLNFFQVGREYIQDKELRRTCGYRKPLQRVDLKPEISTAVFAAKPPQLLKPIVTSSGVHLVLVEEAIEPQLDRALIEQIQNELFLAWIEEQIKLAAS